MTPDWLSLAPPEERMTLVSLLDAAPRSQAEQAHQMLSAPPRPHDRLDAIMRVSAIIRYLATERNDAR